MTKGDSCDRRFNAIAFSCAWLSSQFVACRGFAFVGQKKNLVSRRNEATKLMIFAPPGSGYSTPEDETSELPDSYSPMMEYPGTMRPGRTPENMPFHDLPIADSDPDPVPWPHFQEIEWHHRWDPPHPHPIPMEEFIELEGRWATPEMEAAMRAGNRRDARRRREMEEEAKRETLIMDDDEDDQDEEQDLGDGMFGQLGSAADQAMTAAATAPRDLETEGAESAADTGEDVGDGGLDDFLLDLGLDSYDDEDESTSSASENVVGIKPSQAKTSGLEDVVIGDDDDDDSSAEDEGVKSDVTASIDVDEDDDLDLGLDEDDDLSDDAVSTVPLEDFSDGDDLGSDEFFDDGGFDYDYGDYDGGDGGESW